MQNSMGDIQAKKDEAKKYGSARDGGSPKRKDFHLPGMGAHRSTKAARPPLNDKKRAEML